MQCLLQFGNLCALQSPRRTSGINPANDIGLCYIAFSEQSAEYELTVVLRPSGAFDLRQFHHAVRTMPSSLDSEKVKPEAFEFCKQVSSLSSLLNSEDGLLSWTSDDMLKKVVVISSRFLESVTGFRQLLLISRKFDLPLTLLVTLSYSRPKAAADHLVTVEFVELEPSEHPIGKVVKFKPDHLGEPELAWMQEFATQVSELENCTVHRVHFDPWSLMRLLKLWHQDLVFTSDGPVEAVLLFPVALSAATNKLFCSFQLAVLQLADVFKPCKICTCHGRPIAPSLRALPKPEEGQEATCGVSRKKLGTHACTDNGIIVGSGIVLSMPSFKTPAAPSNGSFGQGNPVAFDVIKCVPLATLSEGLLFGIPHIISPSSDVDHGIKEEVDDIQAGIQVNEQIFAALRRDLHVRDCGLLCTSTRNIESGEDTAFLCFYILLPAQNGSLLAKRLAGAEEMMVLPESATALHEVEVPDQIEYSVSWGLSKLGTEEYNPLKNLRGCHLKLTCLVKESLQTSRLYTTEKSAGARPQVLDAGWTEQRQEDELFISDYGFDSEGRSLEKPQPPPNFILSATRTASSPSIASLPATITPRTGKRASNRLVLLKPNLLRKNAPWTARGRGKTHQGLRYPPLPKQSSTNAQDPYSFSSEPGPSTELPLLPSKRFPNFKTARQLLLDTTTQSSS